MRRSLLIAGGLVLIAAAVAVIVGTTASGSRQEKEVKGSIEVSAGGTAGTVVAVSLFHEGKLQATQDLPVGKVARFNGLPLGEYEVHFESPGKVTIVRRCAVREEDKVQVGAHLTAGKGTVVLGGGPSIQDLKARIDKLEKELEALKSR
jgi:hypothetical protein